MAVPYMTAWPWLPRGLRTIGATHDRGQNSDATMLLDDKAGIERPRCGLGVLKAESRSAWDATPSSSATGPCVCVCGVCLCVCFTALPSGQSGLLKSKVAFKVAL